MTLVKREVMSMLGLGLAAVLLAGCGHGAAASATADKPSAAKVRTQVSPRVAADVRACAGVQAILGHLSVSTSQWSPTAKPFDQAISHQIRVQATQLDRQAPQAGTPQVRAVVLDNGGAFMALADAMLGKDRAKVAAAVAGTKASYRDLKVVCSLGS